MKKIAKRLSLDTQTIRVLQTDDLRNAQGGSLSLTGGTTIIRGSGTTVPTSIIQPGTGQSTGTSIISGGH